MTHRLTIAAASRRLVSWAAATEFDDLPGQVASRAARVIADNLAAIVAARDEPEVACFHQVLIDRARLREATLFRGGRPQTDRVSAAVGNALAADWLELEEGYRHASCHAGLFSLPALLAEAEAARMTVKEVLRCLAIAYEIVTRVARAFDLPEHAIHGHARYAAIGAASATALAKRVPQETMLGALTAAATLITAGPHEHGIEGALIRNAWPAVGTWSGMMSVDWAGCGIAGLPAGLHDVYTKVLGGEAHAERLDAGLGESWAIMDGYSKMHACCQFAHSAVEAVLKLRQEWPAGISWNDIDEIHLASHRLALPMINFSPTTTLAAKFSMPHIVATTFFHGHADVPAFTRETLNQPSIAALRSKVKVTSFSPELPPPNDRPARVTVKFKGGKELDAECLSAPGGPDQPFLDAAVVEKIEQLTRDVYPRYAGITRELIGLDSRRLEQGWEQIVAEICGTA